MSVLVRRFWKADLGETLSSANGGLFHAATLESLKPILQTELAHLIDTGSICIDLVMIGLTLVNVTLSGKPISVGYQALACQAATAVLSVLSSLRMLSPYPESTSGGGSKYINALRPHVDALHMSLIRCHASIISHISLSTLSFHRGDEVDLSQRSKELQSAYSTFSLKASFFITGSRQSSSKTSHEDADGWQINWDTVKLLDAFPSPVVFQQVFKKGIPHNVRVQSFWDDMSVTTIRGKAVLLKTYQDNAVKSFQDDLDILRSTRHSNLPSLFGHSTEDSSTKFIAISMDSFVPLVDYLPVLAAKSPETGLGDAWNLFISLRSTAQHLLQQGMIHDLASLIYMLKTAVVDSRGQIVFVPRISGEPGWVPLSNEDIPGAIATFFLAHESAGSGSRTIDRFPRRFRSLQYALLENPAEFLHSSFARLTEVKAKHRALNRWRPSASRPRHRGLLWPPGATDPADLSLALGDIGRFVPSPSGGVLFERVGNVQTDLGGYLLESQDVDHDHMLKIKRVTPRIWRISPSNDLRTVSQPWSTFIPLDICLDFLSRDGRELSQKHDIPVHDLVLITRLRRQLWIDRRPYETDHPYVFAHFDYHGRLQHCYWSISALYKESDDVVVSFQHEMVPSSDFTASHMEDEAKFTCQVEEASYVQIEEDELQDPNLLVENMFTRPTSIGDVGYFSTGTDGKRRFRAVCNVASDLVDSEAVAWEGNPCQYQGDGVWRSPPFDSDRATSFCCSWIQTASVGLPKDIERFYIFLLASEYGKKAVQERDSYLVSQVVHQIHVKFPSETGRPAWLFVHFDESGFPERAYWSYEEDPDDSESDLDSPAGYYATIRPGITNTIQDLEQPSRYPYTRIKDRTHSLRVSPARRFEGQRLGDIGYWSKGQSPRWVHLDRSKHISLSGREMEPIIIPGSSGCEQVSEEVWQSRKIFRETEPCQPIYYQWTEQVTPAPSDSISELESSLLMGPEDLQIVTRVTIDVFASVDGHSGYGSRHNHWLYVYFPSDGGCYAYFSADEHCDINLLAFSKLDLEDWEMRPFKVHTSITVECKSFQDFFAEWQQEEWG